MKKLHILLTTIFSLMFLGLYAQNIKIKGRVVDQNLLPIEGASVTVSGAQASALSDSTGYFEIETPKSQGALSIMAEGFYPQTLPLQFHNGKFEMIKADGTSNGASKARIVLISVNQPGYDDELVLPFGNEKRDRQSTSAANITQKDLNGFTIESALQDRTAGLRILQKSGMPGEGGYLNLRGVHSLVAENNPLIVVNGVPYMPDQEPSGVINGYSRSLFAGLNVNDIKNITVLKGAAASLYGSLGSNGVVMIETEQANSENLETEISFSGNYGMNWSDRELPLMSSDEYKKYLMDIGMTRYNTDKLLSTYEFLKDDPSNYNNYLYNNHTNWQKEIRKPSFVTDNVFRIKGGDAIAKYNISLGYTRLGGVLDGTHEDRYHTLINTNILVNEKFSIFTNVGLGYMKGALQEQGMTQGTNAFLESVYKMPFLSPYKQEADGSLLSTYASYRYGISNPVGIINLMNVEDKIYDVNVRIGLNYKVNRDWTLNGVVGLFYRYTQENVFIPGETDKVVIPLGDVSAKNTVREGIAEQINMYYNVQAAYNHTFADIHRVNAFAGAQFITSRKEYDAATGYNTGEDVYTTLDYVSKGTGRFSGYNHLWNWMNYYLHADYTYNELVKASVNVSLDAASVTGDDANTLGVFPSGSITFMAANLGLNAGWLNRLDLRAEYGLTGNSRFSSNYGKNYYQNAMFQEFSGIVRSNVPNTRMQWEQSRQLNLGLDLAVFNHRLNITADYYKAVADDLLFARPISAVYGSKTYYDNQAKIETNGVELAVQAAILRNKNVEWTIGGNIATAKSKLKSLGGDKQYINKFSETYGDDVQVISRVGEDPYQFYGFRTNGVYASTAEAQAAGIANEFGTPYQGGDIRFVDQNDDHKINDDDRVALGSAAPDYFGSFGSSLRIKNFTLSALFSYSVGNYAYNAVRRKLESADGDRNQTKAVINRWRLEGQQTTMPRADWGDPTGNNNFSDRWVEDASFVKLRNVTLAYTFNRKVFNFFRSGTLYVTGENLCTWTDYLGMDPEFSYSYSENMQGFDYAKNIIPKMIKFGFNLKF